MPTLVEKVSATNVGEAKRPTLTATLTKLTWQLTWKEREMPTLVEKVSDTNVGEEKKTHVNFYVN